MVAYDTDVFDTAPGSLSINDANYIGESEFSMQSLVSKRDRQIITDFTSNGSNKGKVEF